VHRSFRRSSGYAQAEKRADVGTEHADEEFVPKKKKVIKKIKKRVKVPTDAVEEPKVEDAKKDGKKGEVTEAVGANGEKFDVYSNPADLIPKSDH
jgi:3-phosphoglycerate kinase